MRACLLPYLLQPSVTLLPYLLQPSVTLLPYLLQPSVTLLPYLLQPSVTLLPYLLQPSVTLLIIHALAAKLHRLTENYHVFQVIWMDSAVFKAPKLREANNLT